MTYTNDDQCIFSDQCQKQFYRRVNRFEFEGGGEVVHNYGNFKLILSPLSHKHFHTIIFFSSLFINFQLFCHMEVFVWKRGRINFKLTAVNKHQFNWILPQKKHVFLRFYWFLEFLIFWSKVTVNPSRKKNVRVLGGVRWRIKKKFSITTKKEHIARAFF